MFSVWQLWQSKAPSGHCAFGAHGNVKNPNFGLPIERLTTFKLKDYSFYRTFYVFLSIRYFVTSWPIGKREQVFFLTFLLNEKAS